MLLFLAGMCIRTRNPNHCSFDPCSFEIADKHVFTFRPMAYFDPIFLVRIPIKPTKRSPGTSGRPSGFTTRRETGDVRFVVGSQSGDVHFRCPLPPFWPMLSQIRTDMRLWLGERNDSVLGSFTATWILSVVIKWP